MDKDNVLLALSNPIRRDIVEYLWKVDRANVSSILEDLGFSLADQSKISFHLKTLRDAEILKAERSGRYTFYSLNTLTLATLKNYLEGFTQ